MTNLEWLAENIDVLRIGLCEFAYFAKHGSYCKYDECIDCEFMGNTDGLKTLMEWLKEKKR